MKIVRGLDRIPAEIKPCVATIGVFDGVHRGHQALIRAVVEQARARSVDAVVVTFDRHPLEIIAPGKEPPLLTTDRQRSEAIAEAGADWLVLLEFDEEFRSLSPEAFVEQVIVGRLGCVHVVTGVNFRFGYGHAGTIETLTDLAARYGFEVAIFALVADGEPISSSRIRALIAEGDVETAAEDLGRPVVIEGTVGPGAGRGRGLGIPTANLVVDERLLLPGNGVYAGWLRWRGGRAPAVINVGLNPTFEDRDRPIVEAHALDFDEDLYGQEVGVEFTRRLRDERPFESVEALMDQIHQDIAIARDLLKKR